MLGKFWNPQDLLLLMDTEIFKIDASWAEKLKKTMVSKILSPTAVSIDVKIEQLSYSMTESKCSSVLRIQYSPNLWGQPVLYLCVVMYLCVVCVPAYYSRYSYHHRPDMETRSCIILYNSISLR